ncbi:MAG: hypothetical protein JOY62_00220 [Acidobacteriaceae bacterium]|nr:hypothetical protein [Acidobacteriaceae bacterium]MBV9778368.1 hypothetical protein [Acidobacteriaceae bacterium]
MRHRKAELIVIGALVLSPAGLHGQGFGKVKKSVTLERKLPAAVTLRGPSFVVKASAANQQNKEVGDKLQQVIETDLAKYNHDLYVSEKPDTVITVNVLNFNVPQPIPVKSQSDMPLTLPGKKNKQQQSQQNQGPTAYKYTGTLTAAYQAKTSAGRFLDAENITVNFSQTYTAQGSKDDNAMNKAVQAVKMPWNKLHHKQAQAKEDEPGEQAPHTVGDVEQILMARMTERIAARLVNTDEKVDVLLAKGGDLDAANKYADAEQWTPMIEALKTMNPFPSKEQDAYRLYNIGVANEALGYKAETPAAAKRYLEEASIEYGKAIDANPSERYFLEPQNRIQTALEHFKKLNPPAEPASKAGTKKAPVKKRTNS